MTDEERAAKWERVIELTPKGDERWKPGAQAEVVRLMAELGVRPCVS